MALKACKECGQQVAASAETCPHCGVRNPTGKILDTSLGGNCSSCIGCVMIVIIGMAVLFFLGILA